jgi:hypothetical protein
MASSEKFLPLPTEEPYNSAVDVPVVPNYSPNGPGPDLAGSLSVEAFDEANENSSTTDQHMMCCKVCCDFRRAVLAMDSIAIVLRLLEMVGVAIMAKYFNENVVEIESGLDDDVAIYEIESMADSGTLAILEGIVEVFDFIAIILYICGIYGALNFKRWGIITAMSAHAVMMGFGLLMGDFGSVIFYGFFVYPHAFMLRQMSSGIMTDYNYHKIASCCGDRKM